MPGAAAHRRHDAHSAAAARVRRACSALQTAPRFERLRHGDHRRRPGGSRRRRLWRLGGLAHYRRRAGGAGRPGGDVVAHRELSRLSNGVSGSTNSRAGRSGRPGASGAEILVDADDRPRRSARHAEIVLDNEEIMSRAHRHPRVRRDAGAGSTSTASTGCLARASSTAPRAAKRASLNGLDVHLIGAGNSAGQAAMLFRQPRANRDPDRPRRVARKEHVALSDRPVPHQIQYPRGAARPRSRPSHGDSHLTAIDILDRRTNDGPARRFAADCSCSSAPTRKPAGCRRRSRATPAVTS